MRRRDTQQSAGGCWWRSINSNQTSSWGEKDSALPSGGGINSEEGLGGMKSISRTVETSGSILAQPRGNCRETRQLCFHLLDYLLA